MALFTVEQLSFTYPNRSEKTLRDISFTVQQGEFVTLCGKSGCGKTTLLRLLKSALAPTGSLEGTVFFRQKPISAYTPTEQASSIGFVMQNPDSQIVTDKVWHEMAFGLESLGLQNEQIRIKVAEMASFFGIEHWFHKKVSELSGGQKQLLSLASVMVMEPSVLILDEPTAQLDPIAAGEFLKTLEKINRELGTTVILSEHRLEEAFPLSHRVLVMDDGMLVANGTPYEVAEVLYQTNHRMFHALPVPMRIFLTVAPNEQAPLTVCDGRIRLEEYAEKYPLYPDRIPIDGCSSESDTVLSVQDVFFRYEKNSPDVLKHLNFSVKRGEIYAILGGNGTGKTTALSVLSGLNRPWQGKVTVHGQSLDNIPDLHHGVIGAVPQDPQSLFSHNTVLEELSEMSTDNTAVEQMTVLFHLKHLLDAHPYDLSGGEQQRLALAKVLLTSPDILLLDEPTKGMDALLKDEFANILKELTDRDVTVVMVSHDIEFCAEYASRCAMFFDGSIISVGKPREFFIGKQFYTTSANRMARGLLPKALLAEDVVLALGKKAPQKPQRNFSVSDTVFQTKKHQSRIPFKKQSLVRKLFGIFFLCLSVMTVFLQMTAQLAFLEKYIENPEFLVNIIGIGELFLAAVLLSDSRRMKSSVKLSRPRSFRLVSLWVLPITLLVIFLTVWLGGMVFGKERYYTVSLLVIVEAMLPFFVLFEKRKPQAREVVLISVLCALGVAGRTAFAMIPQFKPVLALVIITGVCFGSETGFLVGAITAFVSNFFFGQTPLTPWQMFATGTVGFLSGMLFQTGFLKCTRWLLCTFGAICAFLIYGVFMNGASALLSQGTLSWEIFLTYSATGLPFDVMHGISTVFFLWVLAIPMTEKLQRIQVKYQLF